MGVGRSTRTQPRKPTVDLIDLSSRSRLSKTTGYRMTADEENAYRAPQANVLPQLEPPSSPQGAWRDGPYLVVHKSFRDYPDRCIVCNAPQAAKARVSVRWIRAPIVLIVVGLVISPASRCLFGLFFRRRPSGRESARNTSLARTTTVCYLETCTAFPTRLGASRGCHCVSQQAGRACRGNIAAFGMP